MKVPRFRKLSADIALEKNKGDVKNDYCSKENIGSKSKDLALQITESIFLEFWTKFLEKSILLTMSVIFNREVKFGLQDGRSSLYIS